MTTMIPPAPDINRPRISRMHGEGGTFWILRPTGNQNPAYVVADREVQTMLRSIDMQIQRAVMSPEKGPSF